MYYVTISGINLIKFCINLYNCEFTYDPKAFDWMVFGMSLNGLDCKMCDWINPKNVFGGFQNA